MIDKVDYWLDLCDDDIGAAKKMLESKYYLHMGFLCHLTTEKALKAVIAAQVGEVPPKTHDLLKLTQRGGVYSEMSEGQLSLIRDLSPLNIEGRYPEYKERLAKTLTPQKCRQLMRDTEEFVCWIRKRLGK